MEHHFFDQENFSDHVVEHEEYPFSSEQNIQSFGQTFGKVKKVKIKKGNTLAKPQVVITLQFKIKSLTNSLKRKLEQGSTEANYAWNYCNATSSKAIESKIWLSSFDLNNLMSGASYHEDNNPYGFQVLPASSLGLISQEYVTRRNKTKKKQLRFRKSFGEGKNYGWIPFKEENINISYPYTFLERKETVKEKLNKKTGEITTHTTIKEKEITKHLRVAGKNTPEDNLHALYSLENNSGKPYGLPSNLGKPVIKIMGRNIKVFNEQYLGYYLYHLGARVKTGSFNENQLGEWFVNLQVSIDQDIYLEKHLQGKLGIPEVAPQEFIGLDPGTEGAMSNCGTLYCSGKPYQALEEEIKLAQSRNQHDKVKRLHVKAKNIREDNINKNALDIVRKAQYIKIGNLNLPVVVKQKHMKLTQEELEKQNKKEKSEKKKQQGIAKKKQQEKRLQGKSKKALPHSKKQQNNNKTNTKKRKSFGKSLLDQGLGKLKLRLGNISHSTGRSFDIVNECYTTQVCSNCDAFSGPRGLMQLGVRQWKCFGCGFEHHRDQNAGKNMDRTNHIFLLVKKHKTKLKLDEAYKAFQETLSRAGMPVPKGEKESKALWPFLQDKDTSSQQQGSVKELC